MTKEMLMESDKFMTKVLKTNKEQVANHLDQISGISCDPKHMDILSTKCINQQVMVKKEDVFDAIPSLFNSRTS